MKSYPLGLVRMMKSTSILSRSTWKSPRSCLCYTKRKINMLKQTTKRCWNHITFSFIIEKAIGANFAALWCFTDMNKIWTKEMSWKQIWILVPIFPQRKKNGVELGLLKPRLGPGENDGEKKWLWDHNRWQVPWEQSWDPRDGSLFMTPGKCWIFYGNGHVENGRCDQLMVNWWLSVGWWFGIQMGQP